MHHLSHLRLYRQGFAVMALCGLLSLLGCNQARAGNNEATTVSSKQRNAAIGLRVLPSFGGSVTSAHIRWERKQLSMFGWFPGLFRCRPTPTATPPFTENILVSGSVEPQMGYSSRLGSHVDIVVIDQRGRSVERIAARYLPSDLTIRPRDPIGRRAFFAETLTTPIRAIRSISLRYHHGPDGIEESHL